VRTGVARKGTAGAAGSTAKGSLLPNPVRRQSEKHVLDRAWNGIRPLARIPVERRTGRLDARHARATGLRAGRGHHVEQERRRRAAEDAAMLEPEAGERLETASPAFLDS